MIRLVKLAEQKGWRYNDELVRIGIKMPTMFISADDGLMEADIPEEERKEVGYYTMRQIERWLMQKHDIYISVNHVTISRKRVYDYFINYPDRENEMSFPQKDAGDSIDKALYNALTNALKTLPNK